MAGQIANLLMGKYKPTNNPASDSTGDYVVVVNAARAKFVGKRATEKIYRHHTGTTIAYIRVGYPGGLKEIPVQTMMAKFPDRVIKRAVKGMLPRNNTRPVRLERLKVYAGPEHPHTTQFGTPVDVTPEPTEYSLEETYPSHIFHKDMDWKKLWDNDIKRH